MWPAVGGWQHVNDVELAAHLFGQLIVQHIFQFVDDISYTVACHVDLQKGKYKHQVEDNGGLYPWR